MSKTSTIITISDTYRIRKIPYNYSLEKWVAPHILKFGSRKGQRSSGSWKVLDVYHGSLKDSLLAARRLLIEDELAQYDELLLEEAIKIIESVDNKLIDYLDSIKGKV